MPRAESAGVLLVRGDGATIEVLLVHPGGPFWAKKDEGAWSIPKGEIEPGDEAVDTARRELEEETGARIAGEMIPLTPRRQAGGKRVHAWAARGDVDPERITSNTFTMEWPPRSGRHQEFPEVDRAAWFDVETARRKILSGQTAFLDELLARLGELDGR